MKRTPYAAFGSLFMQKAYFKEPVEFCRARPRPLVASIMLLRSSELGRHARLWIVRERVKVEAMT